MFVNAKRYIRSMGYGGSQPHLLKCDDGKEYVVKFMSNPQGIRVLVNELIAYRLAEKLGLPVAKGKVIYISSEIIEETTALKNLNIQPGPHFGSEFENNAEDNPFDSSISKCANIKKASGMIAFDHWIDNIDRCSNPSNLLVVRGEEFRLLLIDHGHIFFGPNWNKNSLTKNKKNIRNFWGENYDKVSIYINQDNPFFGDVMCIEYLDDLDCILAEIPSEWGLIDDEIAELTNFLEDRKSLLADALETNLKGHFSKWR